MIGHLILSSLFIAVFLLIRQIFRKKVSPRILYALWAIVALRLFIPFQPFTLTVPAREPSPPVTELLPLPETAPAPETIPPAPDTVQPPERDPFSPEDLPPAENIPEVTPPSSGTAVLPISPENEPGRGVEIPEPGVILRLVWAFGAAAVGSWFALTGLIHSLSLRKDRVFLCKAGKTKVCLSPRAKSACVAGIIPTIYLDSASAKSPELELILAHEKAHIRQGDPIWNIVRTVAAAVYWWNPLVWVAVKLSSLDAELSCDSAVCRNLDEAGRLNYAKTLLDLAPRRSGSVLSLGGGELKERIKMLTTSVKKHLVPGIIIALLTLFAAGCSLTEIERETTEQTEDTAPPTVITTEPTSSATEKSESSTAESDTAEPQPPQTETDTPEEELNLISVNGENYWYSAKYNTTARGKYDEDNFLERFSALYKDVTVIPGKTVIASNIAYSDGTLVYITARDGSWTYGPATVKTHHTADWSSSLDLYFASEEEAADFEAINLSGCTVYEIHQKLETPSPIELNGTQYYTVGVYACRLLRTLAEQIETEEEIPDYSLLVSPELIPKGCAVYLESASIEGLTFGPITNILYDEGLGNTAKLVFNDSETLLEVGDLYSQYDRFIIHALTENPDSALLSPVEPEEIPFYSYELKLHENDLSLPGYAVEIHKPVPDADAYKYDYGHPLVSDLSFSHIITRTEITEKLYGWFSPTVLEPINGKSRDFQPDYYLDFNNGWVVGMSLKTAYCEAVCIKTLYDGEGLYNHLYDEDFAAALEDRGLAYIASEEAVAYVAELMAKAEIPTEEIHPSESHFVPSGENLLPEPDENWKNVSSARICYPMRPGYTVEEDYPIPHEALSHYVTYTVDDPETISQLIACLHPDNLKLNASTYRSPPETFLCFDNGYIVGLYYGDNDFIVAQCLRVNGERCAMTTEATDYLTELFRAIEAIN